MIFTVINSDYQKTLTYSEAEGNDNHTTVIRNAGESSGSRATTYALPNNRIHGTVTLTKQDADSNAKLNGVKYTLTRTDPTVISNVDKWFPSAGNQSITVETGKTYSVVPSAERAEDFSGGISDTSTEKPGDLVIKDLQWGTYTLVEYQETDGYILDAKTFTFTVSADGLTKSVTDTGKNFVTNTKNQLTIQKTALDGRTPLSGAQFQLYPVTKSGETETMDSTPASFYTAADAQTADGTTITAGETTIYGLTKGTYVLRETKAPDGYELTKDVIFTMAADG